MLLLLYVCMFALCSLWRLLLQERYCSPFYCFSPLRSPRPTNHQLQINSAVALRSVQALLLWWFVCCGCYYVSLFSTLFCLLFFPPPFSFAPVFSLSPSESDFTLSFTVVCRISSNLYVSQLHKNSFFFFLLAFTSSYILK